MFELDFDFTKTDDLDLDLFDPPIKMRDDPPDPPDDEDEEGLKIKIKIERDHKTEHDKLKHPRKIEDEDTLETTWWLLGDERQELSNIYERAGNSLDKTFEYFKIYPINIDGQRKLFGARYEFPQLNHEFIYKVFKDESQESQAAGLIDFLTGFPLACTEMLVVLGQYSSREEQVEAHQAKKDDAVPPFPHDFFEGYEKEKRLLNLLYIDEEGVETLADGLPGEPKEEGLHWWCRVIVAETKKYPIPGEFFALVSRPWVTLPWGDQESTPYMFSGEWMDTVYYTGAVVKEVINDPDQHYPTYKVQWRKEQVTVNPTDFADYQVGDFVTILKKVPNKKNSQLWRDDDTKEFDEEEWVIAPFMFYGFKGLKVE